MRKFILMLALALSSSLLWAQSNSQDEVRLKNGSIIRGVITEQVFGEHIKIKTSDGNLFVFKASEIEKVSKVEGAPQVEQSVDLSKLSPKEQKSFKKAEKKRTKHALSKGYVGMVEGGYVVGNYNRLKFDFINGYQFSPYISLGLGLGFRSTPDVATAIPVYLHSQVNFTESELSPFFSQKLGVLLGDYGGGAHLESCIGLTWRSSPKIALKFSIGYEWMEMYDKEKIKVPYDKNDYTGEIQYRDSSNYFDAEGFSFTIGAIF